MAIELVRDVPWDMELGLLPFLRGMRVNDHSLHDPQLEEEIVLLIATIEACNANDYGVLSELGLLKTYKNVS